ncbi:MAG: hypothetical protein WDM78_02725 [Puia sp.]
MNEKVKPITRVLEDSFVYSCTFDRRFSHEQFVPYHVLAFQISGETHIQHQNGKLILKKNRILLAHKNQLAKSLKIPATDKAYKIISVILTDTSLQRYALDNSMHESRKYSGNKKHFTEA